jgi:hypothetical protein
MVTGVDLIECKWHGCGKWFKKGEGHMVACCCGIYPICDDCYKSGKEDGIIKDRKFKKGEMADSIKEGGR